jgi:hypothetical protein
MLTGFDQWHCCWVVRWTFLPFKTLGAKQSIGIRGAPLYKSMV